MEGKIIEGPNYHIKFPCETLGKIAFDSLVKHKGKTAFIDEYTEESMSYDSMLEITTKLSHAFNSLQLKIGDLIAICSENSIHYFCPVLAGWYSGIATVPISNHYLEAEVSHALNLTRPKIIFCSKRNYQTFLKWIANFDFIKHVVVLDGDEQCHGVDTISSFIEKHCPKDLNCTNIKIPDVDIEKSTALILFSSGCTGLPKGVELSQKNYIAWHVHAMDPRLKYFDPNGPTIAIFPFFHAGGMISYSGRLLFGLCTRVFWKFDLQILLSAIEKHHVTSIFTPPPVLVLLAKNPIIDEYNLTSLKEILCGGAPIRKEIETNLTKRLNIKYVRQVYGMTETTLNITIVPPNTNKLESVGKLVPGVAAAIRDPDSGKLLGEKQVGEIIVKGDLVMVGYYKNPQANAEAFLPNGFLRTGDAGYYDEDGYFYIVDRLKELIKFYGYQVPPAEVESILLTHPKILDAAVIGVPDERAGELPLAYIVKAQDSSNLTEDEVKLHVARNLSYQKQLRGGVIFVDQIPKNASGKILRKDLRKLYNGSQ